MRRIFAIALLMLVGCQAIEPTVAHEPRIYEVKVGLASFDSREIYQETREVKYHENGSCTVVGIAKPCMQWGFEFSYENLEPGERMLCEVTFSNPAPLVDVASAYEATTSEILPFTFSQSNGRFIHLMYMLGPVENVSGVQDVKFECKVRRRSVVDFVFSTSVGS